MKKFCLYHEDLKKQGGVVWWRMRATRATCHKRVTATNREHFLQSPHFFISQWYIKGAKNNAIIVKSGEDSCFSRCSYKWTNCQSEHFPRTCGWFQIFQWYFWWVPRKRRRNSPTSLEIQLFHGIEIRIFFFKEIILKNSGEKTLGYCNTMVSKIFRFICSWTW